MCSNIDFSFLGLFLPLALFAFVFYSAFCVIFAVHTVQALSSSKHTCTCV